MPRKKPPALLLVDGYNMIGAWADLTDVRDRHGLEAARRNLVEALISFSASRDYNTEVVFDAHYQMTQGNREVINSYFSIYYTDYRQTADTYIEEVCARLRHVMQASHQQVIVATSDRSHQQTVMGYGANWLSAQQLQTEVALATRQFRQRHSSRHKSSGRFLFNGLDPAAQQRLAELRFGTDGRSPSSSKRNAPPGDGSKACDNGA